MPGQDEEFSEQVRQQEEEAARLAQQSRRSNPLNEEHLRRELEKGPSKINPTADPDRERLLQSYHAMKRHHSSLRTGLLLENIGRQVRLDLMRGPAVLGTLKGVDVEYGEILLEGVEQSPPSIFVVQLKSVNRIEVKPK